MARAIRRLTISEDLLGLGDDVSQPPPPHLPHRHDIIPILVAGLQPVQRSWVAADADLHAASWVHLPLIRQVRAPVRCGLLGAKEMGDLGKDVCVRVDVKEGDGLAGGEVAVAESLEDAARDGVVAADRHGPRPCKRSALSRLP